MNEEAAIHLLLVEDNPADARLIRETLTETKYLHLRLEQAENLQSALEKLEHGEFDLILLDLSLPDSQGLNTVEKVEAVAPEIPVVILTGIDDENLGIQAVRCGAQDYLVKGEVTGPLLGRAIRYAIERHRMRAALRILSLVDELTGLYNRRGFLTLADHQLKVARRKQTSFYLIFADLDGMKTINDTWGHQEGDRALQKTANIIRETFRGSDIIARMGGDEFAIIAIEPLASSEELIAQRFQENVARHNAASGTRYPLSISIGIVPCDPQVNCQVEELLEKADALMYAQKAEHKKRMAAAQPP